MHRRHNIAKLVVAGWFVGATACGPVSTTVPSAELEEEYSYEGEELADLLQAESQEAAVSFARAGFRWDAAVQSGLEIQFSEDGDTWSGWILVKATYEAHEEPEPVPEDSEEAALGVEREKIWVYSGHADVPKGAAKFYRLRSTPGADIRFTYIELMPQIPEPEPVDENTFTTGSSTTSSLTYEGVYVYPRSSWGARAGRCSKTTSMYRMTVHHTGTPTNDSLSTRARLRQIQSYHMDTRGFCDIGYQFLVSKDGKRWQGRALPLQGAHVLNNNRGNIGVSFIGNFQSAKAGDTHLNSAAALLRAMGKKYNIAINRTTIKAHRERSASQCPGDALYRQMNDLVNRAKGSSTIIVDSNNSRNDTSKGYIEVSANWSASSASSDYGTGYWWRSTAATSDPAEFYFYLSSAATKTIDAWWVAGGNRSTAAPFIAYNAGGARLGTVKVNQQQKGGKWNTLGSFAFTRGWNRVVLSCWAPKGKVVIADAVRIR